MAHRRAVLSGAAVAVLAGGAYLAGPGRIILYDILTEEVATGDIDPPTAYARARAGELVIVDIRRPGEWADTGTPRGAIRLDMRRADFAAALAERLGGTDRPVALICAQGVRSARATNALFEAGFTGVLNIPEGMLGSRAGPGWIARSLPLDRL